jgi:hypothetical protein
VTIRRASGCVHVEILLQCPAQSRQSGDVRVFDSAAILLEELYAIARPAAIRANALKGRFTFKAEMDEEMRRIMFTHREGVKDCWCIAAIRLTRLAVCRWWIKCMSSFHSTIALASRNVEKPCGI